MIAAGATILLILLAALFAVKMTTKAKNAVTIRPEIQMLLDLMAMDKDWQKDQYVWYHPSGVAVWVSNKQIGLSVKWGARNINDYAALGDAGKEPGNFTETIAMITEPRDGTLIIVGHPDVGEFPMQWGHIQRNGLFPGKVGMWVAEDGSFTWQDGPEDGPSYWRPLNCPTRFSMSYMQNSR